MTNAIVSTSDDNRIDLFYELFHSIRKYDALNSYSKQIIDKNVVCIICGGNNDNERMPEIEKRAMIWQESVK